MFYDTSFHQRCPGNKVGNAGKKYPVDELLNQLWIAWYCVLNEYPY